MKTLHRMRRRLAGWQIVALMLGLVCAGAAWGATGAGKGGPAPGGEPWRALTTAQDTPQQAFPAAVPAEDASPRGFSHRIHRGVDCTQCHLSRQSHGALKIRTAEDCQACHHGATQRASCTRCHEAGRLPPPSARSVEVRTSVASTPAQRSLPFAHGLHGSVACVACHGSPPQAEPQRACSSCHEQHHTEGRACLSCHRPQDVRAHPVAAHTGCAGGGCHSDPAVQRLSWSRNVCLACHQDRVEHEKSRDCAACHQVPALHAKRQEVAR